jgi:nicotinamide mononucleotide transporter
MKPAPTPARAAAWGTLVVATAVLTLGSWTGRLPLALDEVFGFATGAACVLLVVDESVWNFPVGIANNALFAFLFLRSRLFGDMSLQVVYLILGAAGWWQWTHGRASGGALTVVRASRREMLALAVFTLTATPLLQVGLERVKGAAPFLDAVTTVLSLVAQWLLNRKRIDNWYVWIVVDVVYVYLYWQRHLPLTALLYALFIPMCVAGLVRWRAALAPPP